MKGYRIDKAISPGESLERILNDCLTHMEGQVREGNEREVAVHEIRRTIKRVRAILRLIRDETGYAAYYRENQFYRELSARLSTMRDETVLRQTILELGETRVGFLQEKEMKRFQDLFRDRIERSGAAFQERYGGFGSLVEDLERGRARIADLCRLGDDPDLFRAGLRRVYRRGRRCLQRFRENYSMEEFHEYRKQTKYLLHQLELFRPYYPRVLKASCRSLAGHADLLGEIRDLDRLEIYLKVAPRVEIPASGRKKLIMEISHRRDPMMRKVFRRAGLIYAEKPGAFARRMNGYQRNYYEHHA